MAKPRGSVRIGPISLFTLIIILCLAVLSVLSLTTARAELSITERQAQTTTETYQLETAGQTFVMEVHNALMDGDLTSALKEWGVVDNSAGGIGAPDDGGALVGEVIADESIDGTDDSGYSIVRDSLLTCSGAYDGQRITATFSLESGRQLYLVMRVSATSYFIEQWKVTTQWTDDGTGENLWLG